MHGCNNLIGAEHSFLLAPGGSWLLVQDQGLPAPEAFQLQSTDNVARGLASVTVTWPPCGVRWVCTITVPLLKRLVEMRRLRA